MLRGIVHVTIKDVDVRVLAFCPLLFTACLRASRHVVQTVRRRRSQLLARCFAVRRDWRARHLFHVQISNAAFDTHDSEDMRVIGAGRLDVTNLCHEVVELFLGCRVFRGHLLVFGLPLIALVFEGLDFALVVAGFDVCLAESGVRMISLRSRLAK